MIPEIEFSPGPVATFDDAAIERVRKAAETSPRSRARRCLHASSEDQLHDMVIVLKKGTEIPIHRHPEKAECYHLISGLVTLMLYDDSGTISQRIPLGPVGSGRPFLGRIAAGIWHTVIVESSEAVMHESTTGPFNVEGTEYLTGS